MLYNGHDTGGIETRRALAHIAVFSSFFGECSAARKGKLITSLSLAVADSVGGIALKLRGNDSVGFSCR